MNTDSSLAYALTTVGIEDFLRDNRRAYVESMLHLPTWRDLAARIADFKPDYVICAARKMPRLVQLLQSQDSPVFAFDTHFVSDFAIEFLERELEGKRLGILDDALNVGSTVENIRERAAQFAPAEIKCFCIAHREDGGKALKKGTIIEYACNKPLNMHAYHHNATKLAQSLWMLNRPLECEFPVFALRNLPEGWLDGLWERLEQWDSNRNFYAVDMMDAVKYGFRRLSVLWHPENGLNEKVRLYLDTLNNEMILTPMAFSCHPAPSRKERIRARYVASLGLARDFFASFELPASPELLLEEAEYLFGANDAKSMTAIWPSNLPPKESKEIKVTFYETDWQKIRPTCQPADVRILNDCFVALFRATADFYKAETGTDYGRLCKGPTYGELEQILRDLWEPPQEFMTPFSEKVSHLLDEHIDNGFVVPMTDESGRRVFRKGEPFPWEREALGIAEFVYGDLNPADDFSAQIEKELSVVQREEYKRMILEMEKF